MPTPPKGPRLASTPAHERLMLANLAIALFEHGAITTTEARAKRLRPLAERMITLAKQGDLHARRQVLSMTRARGSSVAHARANSGSKRVVHLLFEEIGPRYANRHGGYTRITKIGPRKGDNAPMAVIELCEALAEQVVAEATGATRRAAKESAAGATPAAKAPAPTVTSVIEDAPEVEVEAPVADIEKLSAAGAADAAKAVDPAAETAPPAGEGGAPKA